MYSVAEAAGPEGQRLLAQAMKQPGPARTVGGEFLDQRQAGQARRVTNFLDEGFGTNGQTAAQAEASLTARRAEDAAANYGAAREGAGAVNVTPAINRADAVLEPGASGLLSPRTDIAPNTIERAVADAKGLITDGRSQLVDFDRVFQAKRNIDGWIGQATARGNGAVVAELTPIQRELDDALARSSQRYAGARDTYAAQSREIEAVGQGRGAAMRGRTEDTVPAFRGLAPAEQQAFRAGYVDPYVEQAQRGAAGINAARPLTSDAVRTEFPAFALPDRGDQLMRQVARENEMFATRQAAQGGSSTFENFADADNAKRVSILVRALKNPTGAIGEVMEGMGVTSSTPETRRRVAEMLLSTDGSAVMDAVSASRASGMRREVLARQLGRVIAGGGGAIARAQR